MAFETLKEDQSVFDFFKLDYLWSSYKGIPSFIFFLADQSCERNYTIILVAFDKKECQTCNYEDRFKCICSYGSAEFIKQLTSSLGRSNERGQIEGALILDSIMNFDSSYDSQNFTELEDHVDSSVRNTVSEIQRNGNRGDFLLTVGRTVKEDYLVNNISKYFMESHYHEGKC